MTQTARNIHLGSTAASRAIALGLLCATLLALLLAAPHASAELTFCPPGEGAGQCAAPEHLGSIRGLAVDAETGRIYVADEGNNRVDVFAEDGGFVMAFGWEVNAEHPEAKLQTCTAATGCRKGASGAGAGQLDRPITVAVDNDPVSASRHDVYVGENTNHRVQKFEPSGAFIWMVGKGVDKTEGGNLCIAASGHACGAGAASEAEGGFASNPFIGVGPGGVLYALDAMRPVEVWKHRLQRFEISGALAAPQCILYESPPSMSSIGSPLGLAVDSTGDLWDAIVLEGLRKFDSACGELVGPIDADIETRSASLAADAADELYAGQEVRRAGGGGNFSVVARYGSNGGVIRRFGYAPANPGQLNGLAAHAGSFGDVLVSEVSFLEQGGPNRIRYVSEPPPGPIAPPPSVEVADVRAAKATALAEVNPEGKPTQFHFDYITQADWEADGEEFGPGTVSTPDQSLGAEGFSLETAEARLGCADALSEAGHPGETALQAGECLAAETIYRFRVVAENEDGPGAGPAEGQPFTTASAPEFGATYATAAGADTATLSAEVNPEGLPTTGYFEYVTEAQYRADREAGGDGFASAVRAPDVQGGAAPLDFGAGEAPVTRSATIYPLQPATTYRYRIVAQNPLGDARAGETEAFRTFALATPEPPCANDSFRSGGAASLPDCRAYELVTPLDKGSMDIRALSNTNNFPALLEQSATDGNRFTFGSLRAFGDAASAPLTSQYIAERIAGSEWRTHSINSPQGERNVDPIAQFDTEFKFFSPDLCDAWQVTYNEPLLGTGAVPGYSNLYRRSDRLCGPESYEALAPIVQNPEVSANGFDIELQGVSADGQHAIFRANGNLAAGGRGGDSQLYGSTRGAGLRLVCVLPSGAAFANGCTAGTHADPGVTGKNHSTSVTGAISINGSRVFWSDVGLGEGRLYVRNNPFAPESPRLHGAAAGTGLVVGPATGTGVVHKGSGGHTEVTGVDGTGFAPHQQLTDSAAKLPAGATIETVEEEATGKLKLILSGEASGIKVADTLTGHESSTVFGAVATSGAFQPQQEIEAPGIPAGTTVEAVAEEGEAEIEGETLTLYRLTLSALATRTGIGVHLEATSPCTEAAIKACTVWVSKAAEEEAATTGSFFWGASRDGSLAVFSTGSLGEGKAGLYSFAPEGGDGTTKLLAEGVLGVIGASEDGRRVYFASDQALTGEEQGEGNSAGDFAVAGKPNLYLYESAEGRSATTFIGTLATGDLDSSQNLFSSLAREPGKRTARVSPDGGTLAFSSLAPLTHYDNTGAESAEPIAELYLYDASTRRLVCASCNPSGARPLSGSSPYEEAAAWIPAYENQLHAARALSDDGSRLFFESADVLSPRDSNGAIDVYEWEAPGAGSCSPAAPTYSPQDEGCIYLISSGRSPIDSRFVEATPDGSDVFFATLSSLVPQDPGLIDIYDARANGGLPGPVAPQPACEGEACQSPPAAPNAAAPASATFHGAGNVRQGAKRRSCPRGERKMRRKGTTRCVKKSHRHRRRHRHHRRANRNRTATR